MPKKKSIAQAPATTTSVEAAPPAFSPAEAKKLVKLLKAADRSKRLDAIGTASRNHEFITAGGCLLPLVESVVPKKKMEDVVKAAGQVIADYLVGREGDATTANENARRAMEQAKKPSKHKLADVMGNLVLSPDRSNSRNAVRSLRAMATVVASVPADNPERVALAGVLTGSGQAAECLCSFFVKQEQERPQGSAESPVNTSTKNKGDGMDPAVVSWTAMRLCVVDTLSVMCETNIGAVQTVVMSGAVPSLLGVVRWITRSDCPDIPLLTSTLAVVFSVAKAGAGTIAKSGTSGARGTDSVGSPSRELEALAEGGAWGTVYDALRGPIMSRAAQLQSGMDGKKTGVVNDEVISPDLAVCLDNMARCAEVLRVMAMTGAGLEQEGALEAGVAAMISVLGMQGLPRGEAGVANLMTEMVKAMGSVSCLSEANRIKVCSAGAVPMILSLMASAHPPTGDSLVLADTPHGRLLRKTAEKCLHHLLVSKETGVADDRALCDTSLTAQNGTTTTDPATSAGTESAATPVRAGDRGKPFGAPGPPYLTVDSVLAALNVDSIDVRCRTIRLVSRLASSRGNAQALGAGAVPSLARLVAWWLRTKDDPGAHRTPRRPESTPAEVKTSTSSSKSRTPADVPSRVAKAPGTGKEIPSFTGEPKEPAQPNEEDTEKDTEEDADTTRVSRDEALAHTLAVLLQLAGIGREARTAIGDASLVEFLAKVLKGLPCTPQEFSSPPCDDSASQEEPTNPTSVLGPIPTPVDSDSPSIRAVIKPFEIPEKSLDLEATAGVRGVMRQMYCWRGRHGVDAEIALRYPQDWGWDFEIDELLETSRPGLVLRAAVLRVLTTVVDGIVPAETSAADCTPAQGKGNKPTGAGAGTGSSGALCRGTVSGQSATSSILEYTLPVCLDLLSVDMNQGSRADDRVRIDSCSKVDHVKEMQEDEIGKGSTISVEKLLGTPVAPSEELLHADVRLGCLQLIASLLRLGGVTREQLLSAADLHRDGWNQYLRDLAGNEPTAAEGDATTTGTGQGHEENRPWIKQEVFHSWDFQGAESVESLKSFLPHVRVVSALLPPLRDSDAPIAHVEAALIALRRLCQEEEHECAGVWSETPSDEGMPQSSSREGAAGALADTLAGVAVSLGALVPLIAIRGTATALAHQGAPEAQIMGIMDQCERLIDFLVQRGQSREAFWSSLPPVDTIDGKIGSALSSSQKKTQAKSRGAQKRGKGSGRDAHETASTGALEATASKMSSVDAPSIVPTKHCGRPDPNGGPDRATWSQLLNSRVDERRTQTFGTTALLMATAVGLEPAVHSLLRAGANPNVRGNDGRTPIMCALSQGMDEAVRGLVEAGADVDAIDSHGCSVLKIAFLCPSRHAMQNIFRRRASDAIVRANTAAAASAVVDLRGISQTPPGSTRRGSSRTDPSADPSRTGRPRSRSRSGSVSLGVCRTRNRSGSLMSRRRSSLPRVASLVDNGSVGSAAGWSSDRWRPSRTSSMSSFSSSCVASRVGRRGSMGSSRTNRGAVVVRGEPRLVPYILACGADPDVSSGSGDFPLHWVVTGTEVTVCIMNQEVRIVFCGSEQRSKGLEEAEANHRQRPELSAFGKSCERNNEMMASTAGAVEPPASLDDSALLRILVERGSSLDACNKEGMTALHAAVISDRPDLAMELLDAGASPNVTDSLGCLPLHYVCLRASHGYEELARRLLLLGVGRPLDKGVHRDPRKGKTRREKLLMDIEDIMRSGLREATAPSSITQHRATRAELLNYVSGEGLTPVHYACGGNTTARRVIASTRDRCSRHVLGSSRESSSVRSSEPPHECIGILRWLLSDAEVDLKIRGPRGTTMLHLAAQVPGSCGADLCGMLIQQGLNLDALDKPHVDDVVGIPLPAPWCAYPDSRGPLVRSTADNIGTRIFGVDVERVCVPGPANHETGDNNLKFSALQYALKAGVWETAAALLAAGASAHPDGAFPPSLHIACHASAPPSIVARLLGSGAFDILENAKKLMEDPGRPTGGWSPANAGVEAYAATPLFLAARSGSAELVRLLLPLYGVVEENGAENLSSSPASEDIWSMRHSPGDGRSPMHAASAAGHESAVQALLEGGGKRWLNVADDEGCIPLDLAVANGKWEVALLIASTDGFDIQLSIARGQSSALLCAERANMAIVDEGSGEQSALSALRHSNALIMFLLEGLRDIEKKEEVAWAEPSSAIDTTRTDQEQVGNRQHETANEQVIGDMWSSPTTSNTERLTTGATNGAQGTDGVENQPALQRASPQRLSSIRHLHPCFAEGVLYSNAKGVRIPDNPDSNPRLQDKESGKESPTATT